MKKILTMSTYPKFNYCQILWCPFTIVFQIFVFVHQKNQTIYVEKNLWLWSFADEVKPEFLDWSPSYSMYGTGVKLRIKYSKIVKNILNLQTVVFARCPLYKINPEIIVSCLTSSTLSVCLWLRTAYSLTCYWQTHLPRAWQTILLYSEVQYQRGTGRGGG
jgi:hypothetical protein